MSTLDSAAVWSATPLAFDEKKIGAAGLSVRQRKLLTLLSQPASLPQLAQNIALPVEDVQAALERFAKLGFAQSSDQVPLSPMQTQRRSASAVEAPSRMPVMIGVAVATIVAIGAGAWSLRGSGPSAASAPVATPAKAQAPTATGPSDTADNGLPGPANKAAKAAPPATPAAVPPPAPATSVNAAAKALPAETARPASPTTAAAALPSPTKAATTPTIVPAAPSATVAPAAVAPTAPALTLATALPVAPVAQPAAAPAVAAPAAAPIVAATQVAAAPVASPPAVVRPAPAAAREIKLVNRVEPTFPRGFESEKGTVRARLQVDARGAVTGVDIVEANPPRVFDRTVRTALQQWRYEPTGEAFSVIAEINFSR